MLKSRKKVFSGYQYCNKKTGGFTMVEIIVTLAILSTSMLAVFGVLRMCTSANATSQRLTESVFLAEKLLAQTTLSDKITYRTTKGIQGQFTWQIQAAATVMDNLAAVCVTVEWLDQQKTQQYQLYSLVHIPALMEGK
jgi:prepilin-type N-terminal cleavage/methylation domain-containing protein